MNTKLKSVKKFTIGPRNLLRYINDTRRGLLSLSEFPVTSYGPSRPDDIKISCKSITMTGTQLKRASTNPVQGLWLAQLVVYVATRMNNRINILELGTAAGISGMYLLAGLAQEQGGNLYTFEGAPELAKLAENNLRNFVEENTLEQMDFDIIIGNFDDIFEKYIDSLTMPIHLAFIDGNHREEATLRYHKIVSRVMDKHGVIVHDDISWSDGMVSAWRKIKQLEGAGKIAELWMGNLPSRGIVFLGADPEGPIEIEHIDGIIERFMRQTKRFLR